MSRAGRASGAQAKRREVQARVAAAAAEHAAQKEAPAPVEMPTEIDAQFRAHRLYGICKADLVRRYPPLWPPEAVGMGIAEQWLQNLARQMQANAISNLRREAESREIVAAAGLVLPS